MRNKGLKIATSCVAATFTFLSMVCLVATSITKDNYQTISDFLGQPTFKTELKDPNFVGDSTYHDTKFNSVAEVIKAAEDINEEMVNEGAVLLKNNNNALPIGGNKKITLFSTSSVDPAYCGGGSGSSQASKMYSIEDELKNKGFILNDNLLSWYKANLSTYGRGAGSSMIFDTKIKDAPWEALPSSKLEEADLAVFVLSRVASENYDLPLNTGNSIPNDLDKGNYLLLNDNERSVLQGIKENTGEGKPFKHSMVLMNTTNQVETSFLNEYNIDSCLWVSSIGSTGSRSIASILKGDVNPSGRLSNIFWDKHYLNPIYSNMTHPIFENLPDDVKQLPYVVYQEGIYNGYRYAETRYEDKLLNKTNVDGDGYTFDYYDAIAYPFGYGLSYSTFEYSDFKLDNYDTENDTYHLSAKVKNTGSVAGKEAGQLYLQKPYTAYDIEHGVEKASVELVDFNKTKILNPGESETLKFNVKGKDLASYDSYNAKTFILEKGDYYFTIAKDSHDAINNILKAKDASIETSAKGNTTLGSAALTHKVVIDADDFSKYSVDEVTGNPVTNQFDNADLTIYDQEGGNKENLTYVTRHNWKDTCKFGYDKDYKYLNNHVRVHITPRLDIDIFDKNIELEKDDIPYPTMGSTATHYSLIDLRVDENGELIPFDHPRWDALLDQLTFDEMADLLSCGVRCTLGISSINKPTTIDHNGGAGMNQSFSVSYGSNRGFAVTSNDPDRNKHTASYAANSIAAATFNKELMSRVGEQWGEDCLWAGYAGIYGPGTNGTRGAYGGRTFEYYSEDPVLGGKISAELAKSIQSKGIYVYLKHAILNECEGERTILSTFANEQTIRELYCKQFEIPIKDGGAKCIMTSLNKIGGIWSGRQGFVNNVFRKEYGMTGFAVTDFIAHSHDLVASCLTGNPLPDRDFLNQDLYKGYEKGYGELANAMRFETHCILYTVVHSAAMNGISSNTLFIPVTPAWSLALDATSTSVYVILGLSVAGMLLVYIYDFLDKKYDFDKVKKENGGDK